MNLSILKPITVALLVMAAACTPEAPPPTATPDASASADATPRDPQPEATYVGSTTCRNCHAVQWQAWRGSHHDLALQVADASTVQGDFDAVLDPAGSARTTFAHTEGGFTIKPDEATPALDVVYTFGTTPLQQYVVEAQPGRLQVMPTPWDTRPANAGGQRWYSLYPGDYPAGDPMHWTGRASNWNGMCADCHSTGVQKGYDPATGAYQTTFAEEDVGCEACHGPASEHVAAANRSAASEARTLDLAHQAAQINACAPCHSRRGQLDEGFQPDREFLDYYRPSLLREELYHVDGQILDEVYVYGSFLQSRMHLKGVACSQCHDPHSATLKLPGNDVCTQCHNEAGRAEFPSLQTSLYDDPQHHFHTPGTAGAACVSCHMTSAIYMGVDERRDHSFRLPRPDLSEALGVPNACSSCHEDKPASWAAEVLQSRFGEPAEHTATALAAARRQEASAEASLARHAADKDLPVMQRAAAVASLGSYNHGYTLDTIRMASRAEPLLRLAATEGAASLSPQSQWRLLSPLLDDDLLAVRAAAFAALLPLGADPQYQQRLAPYFEAYLAAQEASLDFPETLVNVANAHLMMGDRSAAEAALDQALALQANWVPALLNLADLYRGTLRDAQAEALLLAALEAAPDVPEPVFSYALWLTRQGRASEALASFQLAAQLAPDTLQYGYALALALNDNLQADAAIVKLQTMLQRWPGNEDLLYALVAMLRDQQRFSEALRYLDELLQQRPGDPDLERLRSLMSSAAD